jgi:23S rRNA (pseudouridine1915-N3)-methyltransferase
MLKVKVITVGKCKESWLQEALAEYDKRLKGTVEISWTEAKNDAQLETLLLQEQFIALDPKGELLESPSLSQKLMHLFEEKGSRLTFAIGGAVGFTPQLLQKAIWRWSLSPLTFTHQATRLLLVEQLYRSFEIAKGSPYHKE